MVRFTHPEMFYNFIVLFFLLAIYYIKHIRLKNCLKQKLGSKSVRSFLLNRLKVNNTLLRSYLIFLGITFVIFASLVLLGVADFWHYVLVPCSVNHPLILVYSVGIFLV